MWEITVAKQGDWGFVVSADGNPKLFGAVEALVRAAPAVPGFRIDAFRQRGDVDVALVVGEEKFSAGDIWFSSEPVDGQRLAVTLFIKGVTGRHASGRAGAAVLLLDNLLGEYDAVTRIASLRPAPLPAAAEMNGLKPFVELRAVVDALKAAN